MTDISKYIYNYIYTYVWTLMLPPRGKTPGRNFSLCWICLGPEIRILVFCVLHICVYTAYSFGREMLRDCKCPIVSQLRIKHAHMYIIHTTICTCPYFQMHTCTWTASKTCALAPQESLSATCTASDCPQAPVASWCRVMLP